jgi:nucleotide-binding universal stress UspA family protein
MKTLLVPVDFSAPSNNAAAYAVGLANDREFNEIVLTANLHVSLFEQIIPSPDLIQVSKEDCQSRKELLMQQFETLKSQLLKKLNPDIIVRIIISELPLVRSVLEQVVKDKACLVIIGSNSNTVKESFTGRQVIELAKVIPVPVLIVPPESTYQPIVHALVAGELDELSPEKKEALDRLLTCVEYETYNLPDSNILQGVMRSADDKHAQLIIALPGRHSFLYNLTHQNILHGLSLNSQKPVLVLK